MKSRFLLSTRWEEKSGNTNGRDVGSTLPPVKERRLSSSRSFEDSHVGKGTTRLRRPLTDQGNIPPGRSSPHRSGSRKMVDLRLGLGPFTLRPGPVNDHLFTSFQGKDTHKRELKFFSIRTGTSKTLSSLNWSRHGRGTQESTSETRNSDLFLLHRFSDSDLNRLP